METKTIVGITATVLVIAGGIGALIYFKKKKYSGGGDGSTTGGGSGSTTGGSTTGGSTTGGSTTGGGSGSTTGGSTTGGGAVPGESSDIQYIADGGSGGGAYPGTTLIKLVSGVVKAGDVVLVKHPNYNGEFTVTDNNDAYGGSIIYIPTPFKTTGTVLEGANKIDRQKGTVAVIGVPTESSFSGFTNPMHNRRYVSNPPRKIRFLSKSEAVLRKKAQVEGQGKALTGVKLRDFIRAKAAKKNAVGVDGSSELSN